jgi:1,2-diacylglycerol 3-alpha-glucosyltransferase
MKTLGILWAQYGPYHLARVAAMQKQAGTLQVHALELADQTLDYEWKRSSAVNLTTLCSGAVVERLSFQEVFRRTRRVLDALKIEVCLLPSYAPRQSLAALLAAKSLGLRTVMMNESHAGTARARGLGVWVKRRLAGLFDAALVGGHPQKRYFVSLGLPQEKIFIGYDAVDNLYFVRRAQEVRGQRSEARSQYLLPERYFLSLGRYVAKKNLALLIRAFHQFRMANPLTATHLVMVGSGEEEPRLRSLCQQLHLATYDKSPAGIENRKSKVENGMPGVHFYGFRQIDENPVFYALADAFILPSVREEWGLVVNEAMACGLPVVVSQSAGCAEDLLEPCGSMECFPAQTATQVAKAGMSENVRRNGFVFNPRSHEELSRVLLLLEASPALRAVMGQASRRIIEKFSCENFARNALRAAQAAFGTEVKN